MRISFAVEDLGRGGGQVVIVKQANGLAEDHEVYLVLNSDRRSLMSELDPRVTVVERNQASQLPTMDLVLATWWATALWCLEVPSRGYGQFVQSLEDRFFSESDRLARDWANQVQLAGWPTITEATWIQEWIGHINPDQHTFLARNGIDKSIFNSDGRKNRSDGQPLRVIVEGPSAWFKGTRTALEAVANAQTPIELMYVCAVDDWVDQNLGLETKLRRYERRSDLTHTEMADLMRTSDVLIKLSTVEGMPGPPLEAMHCGATVIATPVRGIEEYAVHGYNCALVPFDDSVAVSRWLERLGRNPELLAEFQGNAQASSTNWLTDEQSAVDFESAAQAAARLTYIPDGVPEKPLPNSSLGVWGGPENLLEVDSWTRTKYRITKARSIIQNQGIGELVRQFRQRRRPGRF